MLTSGLSCLLLLLLPVLACADVEIHVAMNGTSSDTTCWTERDSNPCGNLYLALQGMQQTQPPVALVIHPGNYQLNFSDYNHFDSKEHLSFETFNNSEPNSVIINCTRGAGLSFTNIASVTIRGVSFVNCGALHNSTSRDLANRTDQQFVLMYATLYFMNCTNVKLDSISISHSLGIAVQFYATVGTNMITNSNFTENPFPSNAPQGGGVYIEFPYCYPGLSETCGQVVSSSVSKSYFVIQDSLFISNNARVSPEAKNHSTFYNPGHEHFYAFGRGGGISLIFKGQNFNNYIVVQRNRCLRNKALLGACMYIDCQDESNSNNVTVKEFVMVDNLATEGGGGIDQRYTLFKNTVSNNIIKILNCTFQNNSAHWGGGVSVFSGREYNHKHQTNQLIFTGCTFIQNMGAYGAALGLEIWRSALDGVPITPVIEGECRFEANVNMNSGIDGSQEFGIIFMKYMPAIFNGITTFLRNKGPAILAIASSIRFTENSMTSFVENRGTQGAAISLLADSYLVINNGTLLSFVRNHATARGGAIYAEIQGERDVIARNCFLSYNDGYSFNDKPESWNVSISFMNNTAGDDSSNGGLPICRNNSNPVTSNYVYNAIFATTILPCLFGAPVSNSDFVPLVERQKVFCWSTESWHYTCPCPNQEILTEPYKLEQNEIFRATPGMINQFNVTAYDDLEQNVTSYLVVRAESDNANVSLGVNSKYTTSNTLQLDVNSSVSSTSLSIFTLPPRTIKATLNVTISQCPVGFEVMNGICTFAGHFGDILRQSENSHFAKILRGFWVGVSPHSNVTVAGYCLFCRHYYANKYAQNNSSSGAYIQLDFTPDEDHICVAANRQGPFCTECKPNYSMAVYSDDLVCIESHPMNVLYWTMFILGNLLFVTIVAIGLLFLNLPCVAGPLAGALFFVQMVTTAVIVDANGIITYSNNPKWHATLKCVYGFFNLDFFQPFFAFLTVPADLSLPIFHLQSMDAKPIFMVMVVVIIKIVIVVRKNWKDILQPIKTFTVTKCWKGRTNRCKKCYKSSKIEYELMENKGGAEDGAENEVENEVEDNSRPKTSKICSEENFNNMAASFFLLRFTIVAVSSLTVLDRVSIYNSNGDTLYHVQFLNNSQIYSQDIQFLHPLAVLLVLVLPLIFLVLCCRLEDKEIKKADFRYGNETTGDNNVSGCCCLKRKCLVCEFLCFHVAKGLNIVFSFIKPFQVPFKGGKTEDYSAPTGQGIGGVASSTGPQESGGDASSTGPQESGGDASSTGPQESGGNASSTGSQESDGDASSTDPQESGGDASSTGPQEIEGAASSTGPQESAGGASSTGPQESEGGASSKGPQESDGDASSTGQRNESNLHSCNNHVLVALYNRIAEQCWPNYEKIINKFVSFLKYASCYSCCSCGCICVLKPLIPKRGNYKFTGGLYLLLRIVFLTIFAYGPDFASICIAQTVVTVFVGMFVLVFRPYKVNMYNNIDGFFFFALGLLISLCAYQFHLTQSNSDLSQWAFVMQIILLTLPVVWILFYILLVVINKCIGCCCNKTNETEYIHGSEGISYTS